MADYSEPFRQFICSHDPLISVVIPSYKKGKHLAECVESFVAQTYKNIEILIVNDGSPDNTSEVARSLISGFPQTKISLLEKANGGVSDARNYGLKRANGRVVMTMDGDDRVKPHYLETALRELRQHGGDIFRPCQENFGKENAGTWTPQPYDRYFIRYDNCFPTPSVFDKRLFDLSGGFKVYLGYGEDWEFWISCSRQSPNVVASPEFLTCYRMNDDGIAAQFIEGKWQDLFAVIAIANEDLYSVKEVLHAHQRVPLSAPANIRRMRELDALHPGQWFMKFFLGLLAEAEGQGENAVNLYAQAIELSGGRNWQPYLRMAYVLNQRRCIHDAKMMLHEVRILRPDLAEMVQASLRELQSGAPAQGRN